MENVMNVVRINASQTEHTPAGNLLGEMYYGCFLASVLKREEYSGYPNNGGEHTLYLKLPLPDVESFLSLVQEEFSGQEGVSEFVAAILSKIE